MSRIGNPLDSKVLMDTQDSLTNSVVFFLSRSKKRKLFGKSSFLSFLLVFGFIETFALGTGSGQWQLMSINNPIESQNATPMGVFNASQMIIMILEAVH